MQDEQWQTARLRALVSRASRAEHRKGIRSSRVLQEQIQQSIVAAKTYISCVAAESNPELGKTLQSAVSALDAALKAARDLTSELCPPVLYDAGLVGGLDELASSVKTKYGLSVHLDIDKCAEPAAMDMRLLLFDCARELLSNVVKHAGVMEAKLALSRTAAGDIKLVVSDSGRGFNPALLTQRRRNEITFGLLSIKERLTHMGGQMEVDTALGKGARFTLVAPDDSCTVLICDDHEIMRQGYLRWLQSERGIEVIGQAATGEQAVQLAAELSPDVIIMDVSLPGGMSGIDATSSIVAANPRVRVIGVSMHESESVANDMRSAGAVAYLSKAAPHQDLINAILACRAELKAGRCSA